jgi:hypothetical protein
MTIDAKNVLRLNMPQWHALQGVARGRTHFAQVSEILNAVASEADIVGLAIAEYLPWSVVEFAKALNALPLLGCPEMASHTQGTTIAPECAPRL